MFFGLNINYYIIYMKRELVGGFVFVGIVIGMNYILKHFMDEYSLDDDKLGKQKQDGDKLVEQKQDDLVMEDLHDNLPDNSSEDSLGDLPEHLYDNLPEDSPEHLYDNLPEDSPEHLYDNLPEDSPEKVDVVGESDATLKLLDSVIPMVDVLETKLKDDIVLIQQILEKKQHLINLNTRLFEIKERLQELKNDLVK